MDLIYKILDLQKKFLQWYYNFKYKKYAKTGSVSARSRITAHETMNFNAKEKLEAQQVIETAKSIFKEHLNDPSKVFDYIKNQGTPVFWLPNAHMFLWFVGEDEGFIPPKSGLQALFLTICINILSNDKIPFSFNTPPMFVLRNVTISPYFLAYQLYHWMAYSRNLSGYDEQTMRNFKKIFVLDTDLEARKNLSIEEILSLREAIARDIEAINMVVELAYEVSGQKKAMDKLKKDGNISI